jgi:hypothetical protein
MFQRWLGSSDSNVCVAFIAQDHDKYNVIPEWLDPCVLGRYVPGVANDDFNGMEAVVSCHLVMSHAYAVRRRVIGPPDSVVVHREWVADQHYTVVACC